MVDMGVEGDEDSNNVATHGMNFFILYETSNESLNFIGGN